MNTTISSVKRSIWHIPATLALMALALVLFQRGGALLSALVGALLFGALALLRPDLGLLFVPLTVPLYLMPALIPSLRADSPSPIRLPTYEIALLLVLGATAACRLRGEATADRRRLRLSSGQVPTAKQTTAANSHITYHASRITQFVSRYAPHLLFLLAGVLGVVLAAEPSRALREFRWLIVEPLLFYALLRWQNREPPGGYSTRNTRYATHFSIAQRAPDSQFSIYMITAFVLGGALVGLIGIFQFAGLDLAGLLGTKQCFAASGAPCDNIVAIGGVRRATSVYGHPNNLGLYLGRVWPLATGVAVAFARDKEQRAKLLFFILCSLFCLGGIAVSFSRGAWFGAIAALAVLGLGLTKDEGRGTRHESRLSSSVLHPSSLRWLIALGILLAVVACLALSLRGDVTAGSTPTRLLLWREAVGYIQQHPFGIGLDQFGFYHDPGSGHSLIDPALVGTSEQYAAHPHNLLLDIWLRLGPLGLAAFGWLLVRFFRRGLRTLRAGAAPLVLGALAAMVAALAHGLVDNFYFVPDLALAFWLLLAIVEIEIRD
jgi:putative inorganic carbon (hco3(-)) transporter